VYYLQHKILTILGKYLKHCDSFFPRLDVYLLPTKQECTEISVLAYVIIHNRIMQQFDTLAIGYYYLLSRAEETP